MADHGPTVFLHYVRPPKETQHCCRVIIIMFKHDLRGVSSCVYHIPCLSPHVQKARTGMYVQPCKYIRESARVKYIQLKEPVCRSSRLHPAHHEVSRREPSHFPKHSQRGWGIRTHALPNDGHKPTKTCMHVTNMMTRNAAHVRATTWSRSWYTEDTRCVRTCLQKHVGLRRAASSQMSWSKKVCTSRQTQGPQASSPSVVFCVVN